MQFYWCTEKSDKKIKENKVKLKIKEDGIVFFYFMVPPLVDRKYPGHSKWFELVSPNGSHSHSAVSSVGLIGAKLWMKLNTSFKSCDVVASDAGTGTILKKKKSLQGMVFNAMVAKYS